MRSAILRAIVSVFIIGGFFFVSDCSANEAGLVTSVKGSVMFGKDKKDKALNFMKMRVGDTFYLEKDASMQIVFFKNGRKEKWEGVVEVAIQEDMGKVTLSYKDKAKPKSISTSEKNYSEGLREIPDFIQSLNTERSGSVRSRGFKKSYREYNDLDSAEKDKVKETRMIYDLLVSTSDPADITPELYAIGMLSKLKLYRETIGLVRSAMKKQPENAGLKEVESNLNEILKD